MMKKALLFGVMILIIATVAMTGCTSAQAGERAQMLNSQPTATISHSTERDVFMGYLKECSDPNNVQWIYCLDNNGHVILKCPVKAKSISATKSTEPYTRITNYNAASYEDNDAYKKFAGYVPGTEQLMNPSGMFGSDTPGVIWEDPQGNYYEWHLGPYFISSVPLKISAPIIDLSIDQDMLVTEKAVEAGDKAKVASLK